MSPGSRRRAALCRLLCACACASLSLLSAPAGASPVGAATTRPSAAAETLSEECTAGNVTRRAGAAQGGRACERCTCAGGRLLCAPAVCEARPGCKALHRPDECCPTFQCECEQDGRVYGNGEKLVDPADPCKVCYCQGGEVVCRRIACFLRSDCQPRLVPGRCCPQYDNCPLRGVSTELNNLSSFTTPFDDSITPKTPKHEEPVKKEITIKEITPVSEIPTIVSGIRIKEIIPTSEVSTSADATQSLIASAPPQVTNEHVTTRAEQNPIVTQHETQANKNEHIEITSKSPTPSKPDDVTQVTLASSTFVAAASSFPEEEDLQLELVNPAFPPLPDDLSEQTRDDSDLAYPHSSIETAVVEQKTPIETSLHITPELTKSVFPTSKPETITQENKLPLIPVQRTLGTAAPTGDTGNTIVLNPKNDDLTLFSEIIPTIEVISDKIDKVPDVSQEEVIISSPTTETTIGEIKISNKDSKINLTTASPSSLGSKNPASISSQSKKKDLPSEFKAVGGTDFTTKAAIVPVGSTQTINGTSIGGLTFLPSTLGSIPSSVTYSQSSLFPTATSSISSIHKIASTVEEQTQKVAQESIRGAPDSLTPLPSTTLHFDQQRVTDRAISVTASKDTSIFSEFTPVTFIDRPEHSVVDEKLIKHGITSKTTATEASEKSEDKRSGALVATSAPANSNNALSDLIKLVGDVASIGERPPDSRIEISEDDSPAVSDPAPPADRAEPITRRPLIDREPSSPPTAAAPHADIEIINKAYVPSIRRPSPTKLLQAAPAADAS